MRVRLAQGSLRVSLDHQLQVTKRFLLLTKLHTHTDNVATNCETPHRNCIQEQSHGEAAYASPAQPACGGVAPGKRQFESHEDVW